MAGNVTVLRRALSMAAPRRVNGRRAPGQWPGWCGTGRMSGEQSAPSGMHHSPGYPGKLQEGTLPLPEMLLTVTSVPDGVMFVLYFPMLAYSALVLVASRLTFSSVRPSRCDESSPSSTDWALDADLTDFRPLTTMFS